MRPYLPSESLRGNKFNQTLNKDSMKDGWEIKKLGEVCTIERGGSPRPIQSYLTDSEDGINWIKIGDATEGSKYITSTKEKIKPEGVKKSRFVHSGDFILSNSMSFGRPYILAIDGCIHDGWLVIHDKDNTFDKSYLYYYLGSPSIYNEFKALAVGGVVNNLNSELVRNVKVAIPPLPEQERIVSELDCINGILEKKREQIKELDALAQSIFYHMFGDPVTNEKGWEVKKLGEVCKTTSGGTPSKNHNEYYDGGTIPWLRSGEVDKMFIYDTELFITEDGLNNSSAKWFPENTVVIAMYGATVGQVGILKNPMTTNQAICGIFPNETFLPIYLYHFLLGKKQAYIEMASGGAQPNISQNIVRDTLVGCPPLPLQQSFATKIAAIEKQKELIKRSIAEVETLLASRMQHYFNS